MTDADRDQRPRKDIDSALLKLLDDINALQRWLVGSLEKTIRLQLGS